MTVTVPERFPVNHMNMKKKNIILSVAVIALTACGAKKATVTDADTSATNLVSQQKDEQAARKLNFVRQVSDNAAYQQNVVSKINFTLNTGSKNLTVPGSIHMRKDDVIRIQLFVPLLGTEVGRLEFTKDYVMIIDRIHKQYIKGDYNRVDFLRDQGINFYSLQAMFWNQLFLPGAKKVTETELKQYDVAFGNKGAANTVSLRQDRLTFQWLADQASALIQGADITYAGGSHGTTTLHWTYGDFKAFGSKKFPHLQTISFKSSMSGQPKDVKVTLNMSGVTADSDWETRTTVSEKYKEVSVEDVLKQITSL